MYDLNDMRRDRATAAALMETTAQALFDLEAVDGGPQEDAVATATAAFEDAKASFDAKDAQVKVAETVAAAQASSATSEANDAPAGGNVPVPAVAISPADKGVEFGAMVHALANSGGNRDVAAKRLEDDGFSGIGATLTGASAGAGGVLIPQAQAADVIELLRPMVTVMGAGARLIDMPAGEIRNARQNSSASAEYGAENAAAVESEPGFDNVDQNFKTLRGLVPVGNALLRHSSPATFAMVRDDVVEVMGLRKDLAFLRGAGSAVVPKGIINWCLADHLQSTVGNTAVLVEGAIRRVVSKVRDADVPLLTGGWIMRASTMEFLASLREPTHGSYLFPSIEQSGTLKGYPIHTTSQLPDNLGGGGDETEIVFADFNQMMVGNSYALTLATSSEAAYVDVNGNMVSAFQNDLTLLRAIEEHDFAPRHDEAIGVISGAGWSL